MSSKPIRSPSYPNMPLKKAIEAVRDIEAQYRTSNVDREVGAKLMGYSTLSGPANKALAALAAYGLVERAGKGEMRVTQRAVSIIHPANESERREALAAAAQEPKLFKALIDRFPHTTVPPEDGVVTHLNREGFNPSAVKPAAKAFLETMKYVDEIGIETSGAQDQSNHVPNSTGSEERPTIHIGDYIQWESQGTFQFKEPKRVRWISEDGSYLAVDGNSTGIPVEQAIINTAPAAPPVSPPLIAPANSAAAPPQPPSLDNSDAPPREDLGASSQEMNKILTSFDGETVRISAWLDRKGILQLEKKLKAIKMMMDVDE